MKSCDQPDERAFAAAAGSEQRENLATAHAEGNIFQCHNVAETLGNVAYNNGALLHGNQAKALTFRPDPTGMGDIENYVVRIAELHFVE